MENICEWENCHEAGKFKAPVERDNSRNYKWLCEKHIKQFNKKWNYFEGMSQTQIENFIKSDLAWHRPTQKFGSSDNFFSILWNNTLSDKFNYFNEKKKFNNINSNTLSQKDRDAFKILGLKLDADWSSVQRKFKALVKKFHPDRNAGNKELEEKLKKITLAYSHLKLIMIKK
tara:strand:- start:51 stop:569 length:519 start_codon:yes stop_codon:yes gene_type:complete